MEENRFLKFVGKYKIYLLLILYAMIHILLIQYHENWRDEGQAWMIAGLPGIKDILDALPGEGHVALWFLLLRPFRLLGYPYGYAGFLSLGIMLFAGLVLIRLELPVFWKCVLLLSPVFFYFNAVLCRPYSVIVLELVLLCYLYPKRSQHKLWYCLLVISMAQTHSYLFGLVLALIIVEVVDCLVSEKKSVVAFGCVLAECGSFVLALYEVFRKTSHMGEAQDHWLQDVLAKPIWEIVKQFFEQLHMLGYKSFWMNNQRSIYANVLGYLLIAVMVGIVIYGLCCIRTKWRELLLFLGGMGAIAVIQFRYAAQHWQHGLVAVEICLAGFYLLRKGPKEKPAWLQKALGIGVAVLCIGSIPTSMCTAIYDVQDSFSNAKAMAAYIQSEIPEGSRILVCQDSDYMPGLQAYLGEAAQLVRAADGTEYVYYDRVTDYSVPLLVEHLGMGEYLILNGPLDGLELVHKEDGPSFWGENYYLYRLR